MSKQNYVENVVVISTHPDDETLGAGGTILKHKKLGNNVYCIFCTDIFESEGFSIDIVNKREKEIENVCKAYEFNNIYRLGLKTMKVDQYPSHELINKFANIFNKIQPTIIYLPFIYDVHSDHRVIFNAAFSCTKTFRYPSIKKIFMMETLSETEFSPSIQHRIFHPNVFVDISDFFDKKCEIMKIYESEIKTAPFPRSIENMKALAIFRGCSRGKDYEVIDRGGVNCESPIYAESFMLLKEKC